MNNTAGTGVRISLIGIFGAFVTYAALTYSSQPPAQRTGAPGEGTCSGCHSGTSRPGQGITIVVDTDTLTATGAHFYTPGDTDTITLYLNIPGARNGFELTALNQTNSAAGTFILLNTANTSLQSAGGRWYVGHRSASSTSWWQFLWVAPSVADTVTFYVAGNAANGNNSTSGDTIYTVAFTLYPVGTPPMAWADLTPAGLSSPQGIVVCPDSSYQIVVQLLNSGGDTADSFRLVISLNGAVLQDTTVTTAFLPDSVLNWLAGTFTFSAPADTLQVVVSALPSDANTANDTLTVTLREFTIAELSLNLPAAAIHGDTLTLQLTGEGAWLVDTARWRLSGSASVSQDTFVGVGPHSVVVGASSGEDTLYVQVSVLVCSRWYVLFDTVVVRAGITALPTGNRSPDRVYAAIVQNTLIIRGAPPTSSLRLLTPEGRLITSRSAGWHQSVFILPLPRTKGFYILEVASPDGTYRTAIPVFSH